jgi:hypothetical protein
VGQRVLLNLSAKHQDRVVGAVEVIVQGARCRGQGVQGLLEGRDGLRKQPEGFRIVL